MKTLQQNHKMECNFKKSFYLLALLLTFNCSWAYEISPTQKNVKTSYHIGTLADKLGKKELEERLRSFVFSSRPSRLPGSKGHSEARSFILNFLKNLNSSDASLSTQDFTFISNDETLRKNLRTTDGQNIIWEKKGKLYPDEFIVIGAHYDTVLKDEKTKKFIFSGEMPGADVNASGVVMLLSLAELLSKLDLPRGVKLVFFDFEEFDFFGSKEFSKKLLNEIGSRKCAGFIQLSRLGHDTRIQDTEKRLSNFLVISRDATQKGHDEEVAFYKQIVQMGEKTNPQMRFKLFLNTENTTEVGTAKTFRDLGFNALSFTQNSLTDANPRAYTSNDFIETLNFSTYSFAYRFIAASLLGWNYGIVK